LAFRVTLNPPGQYADDRHLRARQRFWQHQDPYFDIAGWVLDLAGLTPGMRVLDAGCGNGEYLRGLRQRQITAVGCDLSLGMLRGAAHPALLNADVTALPLRDGAVDVALAVHMLYHVPDPPVVIRDAAVAAGYVASLATHYQDETPRPWDDVADEVGRRVEAVIANQGAFVTSGDLVAFVCR
jgi:SAM-dependent methyltransferase